MYLIWVGIITAYIFTFIPEWTAWVILVFMAIYDIVAVLVPGGPLKALVELAIERQQELPALIYEARPAGGRPYVRGWGRRRQEGEADGEGEGEGYDGDDRGRDGAPNGDRTPQSRGPEAPLPGAAPISPHGQPPPPNSAQQAQMSQRPGSGRPGSGRPVAESALSQQMVVRNSNGAGGDVSTQSGRNGSGGGALEARRSGSQSGAPRLGSWSAATTRIAPDRAGTGASRLGQSSQSQVPQDGLGMPLTANNPRDSEVGENAVWELQQHGSQVAVSGRYTGTGGRPLAEGREDEQWQPLPGSGCGRAPGGISMRARLAGALSASAQPDSPRSSGNSREPLIDGRGRALEQEPGSTPDATPPDMTPTYRGSAGAGPSNPHASRGSASFPVAQVHAGPTEVGRGGLPEGKAADPYGYPSKPGRSDDGGTMGVRPVPPAISGDQLAAASRRGAPGAAPAPDPPEPELPPGAVARDRSERLPPDDADYDLPDSIKLGLGDFIFYSMLVGRAAMYDFMTVFSAYLAIIAGLGLTLLCLAVFQKALPALPFSIVLGVLFYFLTRLTLEPFLVPLAGNMAYF
ncbi:hypothetical protein HYH03_016553 [Edaphochlamys debaryana]|uniref:Presenilin n=1 Tax=Edaphochlamys debaryana TaxID=47281 RepID=A0A835XJR5_9CHLO|nr:hypothetical protein HYH03_016553 [Edaphochlamys debaryana]|eukprot:KAG2484665.1 hypothetical protein HYH03_016553 [Edaphochlamys debaryana]